MNGFNLVRTLMEASGDEFGFSVALSSDGRTVGACSWNNNDSGSFAGHGVRVFSYDSNTHEWVQLGSDVDGEGAADRFGVSVALAADGRTVAAGARLNDGKDMDAGHVRVFWYDSSANQWEQLGRDIDGEAAGDIFGLSVALSRSNGCGWRCILE